MRSAVIIVDDITTQLIRSVHSPDGYTFFGTNEAVKIKQLLIELSDEIIKETKKQVLEEIRKEIYR